MPIFVERFERAVGNASAPTATAPAGQASATLTVDLTGTGSGGVVNSPAGLSCSGQQTSCSASFQAGTTVTLTATPTGGHTFLGWSGACTGTGACVFNLASDRLVVATFHQPVALVVTYYHTDAIGSVRALTDGGGAVVLRHDYLPFGEDTQALTGDPRRFTGQEIDAESGQHYFHARQYRNLWGRFTTVDPGHVNGSLLDPQGWNAYGYARNNPLKYVDPTGLTYTDTDFSCTSSGGQVDCTVTDTVTVSASDVVLSLERTYEIAPGFCLPVIIDGAFAFNTCDPGGGPYSQARSDGGGGSGGGSIGTVADVVILAMSLRGINLKALQAGLRALSRSLFRPECAQ